MEENKEKKRKFILMSTDCFKFNLIPLTKNPILELLKSAEKLNQEGFIVQSVKFIENPKTIEEVIKIEFIK